MIKRKEKDWKTRYLRRRDAYNLLNEPHKRNDYIFEYIEDDEANRIGVIVAQKYKDAKTPNIGWALMSEIADTPNYVIEKPEDIPLLNEYINMLDGVVNNFKEEYFDSGDLEAYEDILKAIKTFKLVNSPEAPNLPCRYIIGDRADRDLLLDIALARAIPVNEENRKNFYVPTGSERVKKIRIGDLDLEFTDIRNNNLNLKSKCLEKKYVDETCNSIRRAVRRMDFRAWRYYKYEG